MDVPKIAQIVAIMVSPTIAIGAVFEAPRAFRAVMQHLANRREASSWPLGRSPIERIAFDLRRLLVQHDALKRSTDVAMRAQHLQALEGAITDCAAEAAHALQLPCPQRPVRGGLPPPELRRLLQALVRAGLVLPPTVDLLAA